MTTVNQLKGRVLYYRQTNQEANLKATLNTIDKVSQLKFDLYGALERFWDQLNKKPAISTTVPKGLPDSKKHIFVVLGSGSIKGGKIPGKYKRRLKLALKALEAYPNHKLIISGGETSPGYTEAGLGYDWLRTQGIAANRLIKEAGSYSTIGNARNSMAIIVAKGYTSYTVITDATHQRRAGVLFEAARVQISEKKGKNLNIVPISNLSYMDSKAATKAPIASESSVIAYHTALLLNINSEYQAAKKGTGAYPILKLGSTGTWVKALQKKLGITADGIYGPQTKAAVKKAQKSHGLVVDGIAGPNTLKALGVSV